MGLKAFHIFFIVVSAAMCLWVVGWGAAHRDTALGLALTAIGAAGFVGLGLYLRSFLRRTRGGSVNGSGPKLALSPALLAAAVTDAAACTTCVGQPTQEVAKAFQWGIAFLAVLVLGTLTGISVMMYRAARSHEAQLASADAADAARG